MLKSLVRKIFFISSFIFLNTSTSSALEMKEISSSDFDNLAHSEHELKLFFFFTSWCGVCKSYFKDVLSIIESHKDHSEFKAFLISLDDNTKKLEQFTNRYNNQENVYYFDSSRKNISMALYSNGINYRGSIPHLTIFYKNKIVADGNYDMKSVTNFIDELFRRMKKAN